MPSKSAKQHRFMEAVAHNPAFAKKAGVPQSVGKDFSNADKGKTFQKGGDIMATKPDPRIMAMMMAKKRQAMGGGPLGGGIMPPAPRPLRAPAPAMAAPTPPPMGAPMAPGMKKGGKTKKMAKGGLSSGHKAADGVASKGKTKAKMVKMSMGGKAC